MKCGRLRKHKRQANTIIAGCGNRDAAKSIDLGIDTTFVRRTEMTKLRDYIEGQSDHLVNYGLRHRQGKPIRTSTIEGLANTLVNRQMNKFRQLRWSAV